MKRNYTIINENTKEKIRLVNATLPTFRVKYTENNGIKKQGKMKWMPIKYDYAELVLEQ